jgi:hypothetical protein
MFGPSHREKELEAEVTSLRQWVDYFRGTDQIRVAADAARVETELAAIQQQIATARQQLDAEAAATRARSERDLAAVKSELTNARTELEVARHDVVETREVMLLQEVGVYEYRHPLSDAIAYKARLDQVKGRIKAMATAGGGAVLATTSWQVNGSARAGAAMVRDFSKLMLRAYNAEADNCVRTLKPYTVDASILRLSKTREVIARLGKTMSIRIADPYHAIRVEELELTADYVAKKEEEKERIREERERQREEDIARREFEQEKARLLKEHAHYTTALERMRAAGDSEGVATAEERLTQLAGAIAGVESRQANVRAGYVYVISNIGAFGERMVKVGMTRRLDPMDRVHELGDASVPFRFDVHAVIFSDDAVRLEASLHNSLAHQKVNLVNARREFFYATPSEVRDLLIGVSGDHLVEYNEAPEALEWRQSILGRDVTNGLPSLTISPMPVVVAPDIVSTPVAAPELATPANI